MKVFIDTNIFIRLFTHDIEEKAKDCEKLFELVQEGSIKPYISNIVILELIFILIRQYKFKKKSVIKALEKIYKLRNITVIESTKTNKALKFFGKYTVKYGDCLIATQIPKGVVLISYDTEFPKKLNIKSLTPDEIVNAKSSL